MNVKPIVISFENLDLHQFHDLVREWDLEFSQLKPGVLFVDFAQVIYDDIQLGYGYWNLAVRQEGFSPKDMWTFAFPNDVKLFWRNYDIQPASVILYAPNSTINAVSDNGFEVLTFSVSENLLLEWARRNNCLGIIGNIKGSEVLEVEKAEYTALRTSFSNEIKSFIGKKKSRIVNQEKDDFLERLCSLIINSRKSTKMVSTESRLDLLVKSEAAMMNDLTASIKVSELAQMFDVSERTLLYTFKKRYDLGPKAFLNVLKLNQIYHILRDGIDDSIATIARQNGFWHMGQFYRDYKSFFNELPSNTLKK